MSYNTYRFFFYLLQTTNFAQVLIAPKKERLLYILDAITFLAVVRFCSFTGIGIYIVVSMIFSYAINRNTLVFSILIPNEIKKGALKEIQNNLKELEAELSK